MRIGIVAGEPSGDFLGAQLIGALRRRLPGLEFVGIGGPKMQSAGMESWYPMERLAVRGYAEVLRHYAGLVSMRSRLKSQLLDARPSLFIGVDAPDFNLDLELALKQAGIPTMHFVSPKASCATWAATMDIYVLPTPVPLPCITLRCFAIASSIHATL